eukprot:169763_1
MLICSIASLLRYTPNPQKGANANQRCSLHTVTHAVDTLLPVTAVLMVTAHWVTSGQLLLDNRWLMMLALGLLTFVWKGFSSTFVRRMPFVSSKFRGVCLADSCPEYNLIARGNPDYTEKLSDDLLKHIGQFAETPDLARWSSCSTRFHNVFTKHPLTSGTFVNLWSYFYARAIEFDLQEYNCIDRYRSQFYEGLTLAFAQKPKYFLASVSIFLKHSRRHVVSAI